jgi:hypothetical protein
MAFIVYIKDTDNQLKRVEPTADTGGEPAAHVHDLEPIAQNHGN